MSKFATKHENSLLAAVMGFIIFVIFAVNAVLLLVFGHYALIGTAILIAGAVAGWVIFRGMVGPDYAEFKRDALTLVHQGK